MKNALITKNLTINKIKWKNKPPEEPPSEIGIDALPNLASSLLGFTSVLWSYPTTSQHRVLRGATRQATKKMIENKAQRANKTSNERGTPLAMVLKAMSKLRTLAQAGALKLIFE